MKGFATACALTTALIAGPAMAGETAYATIESVKGDVLLSQDGKFARARADGGLAAGDRVVAKGGEASVRYADGCRVTVRKDAMATIAPVSPCAGGKGLVNAASGAPAQQLFGSDFGLAVASWGVMAIIFAVAVNDDDDRRPVSP